MDGNFSLFILIIFIGFLSATVEEHVETNRYTADVFKRSIKPMYDNIWNPRIKYYIKDNYDPYGYIDHSLDDIEKHTCIRFLRQMKPFSNEFGLIFENTCGKMENKTLYNEPAHFMVPKQCMHSLGCYKKHLFQVLAFRGVKNKKNQKNQRFSEGERKTIIFNEERDYSSVSFSGIDTNIASSCPPYYGNMFGYKDTYSFNDLKLLNARYCQSTCAFNFLPCLNDGYQSPNNCGVCICPPGYNGRLCENLDESDATCPGYSYLAERKKKTITICGGRDCLFLLEAPKGYKIVIEIDYALSRKEFPCYRSNGIEIKYNKNKGKGGLCLCGYYENITLPARSNTVFVSFKGRKNAIAMSFSYYTIFNEKDCLL